MFTQSQIEQMKDQVKFLGLPPQEEAIVYCKLIEENGKSMREKREKDILMGMMMAEFC